MSDTHFSNNPVNLQDIVQLQQANIQSLMPKYYQANVVIRISVTLLLLVVVLIAKYDVIFNLSSDFSDPINGALAVITTVGLLSIVGGYFTDRAISYQVRELDITLYSGVIFKKIVTQPFLRLQHIELKRGPIERKVGLATVQVFSAGGSAHTFTLPGLSLEQATALRQYILDHKDVTYHE